MVDDKVGPYGGLAGQFDARENLHDLEQEFIDQGERLAQQGLPDRVTPTTKPVHQQDPKPLSGPVSIMGLEVATYIFEHRLNYQARNTPHCSFGKR